jgi:hypothetical protein
LLRGGSLHCRRLLWLYLGRTWWGVLLRRTLHSFDFARRGFRRRGGGCAGALEEFSKAKSLLFEVLYARVFEVSLEEVL